MELLDQTFNAYFERSIKEAAVISESYQQLWQVIHKLFLSGGKRLRPKMTLLAYEAFGGQDIKAVIPVAAAQELLHFSLLIHDDIIDRDYTRYGVLNVAGQYQRSYAKFLNDNTEQNHFAHSAALLAGDLMLSASHELIATSSLDEQKKLLAQRLLSRSIFEVAGGELLDTELSFMPYSSGDALNVARYKTASYSFMIPLLTGAQLASASESDITNLKQFSVSLGIAYQLVDDLLGMFGDEDLTGKSTTSDILEGKMTYMAEQAIKVLSQEEKSTWDKLFGNQAASPQEIETIKTIFITTGAKQITEDKIKQYIKASEESLKSMNLDDKHQEAFEKLVKKVVERVS